MASETAKAVARDVAKALDTTGKVVMGKIVENRGYGYSTIKNPKRVQETKSYQQAINPIVTRWQKEIDRIQAELEKKNLSDEKYKDLVDSMDKLNKQVQLATGGVTERVGIQMSDEERLLANQALENSDE